MKLLKKNMKDKTLLEIAKECKNKHLNRIIVSRIKESNKMIELIDEWFKNYIKYLKEIDANK